MYLKTDLSLEHLKKAPIIEVIVTLVCIGSWLLHKVDLPPRFGFEPLALHANLFISLGINFGLAILLLIMKRPRSVIIPLLFSGYQVAYIIAYFVCDLVLQVDYSNLKIKILNDSLTFVIEALVFIPFLFFTTKRNPFRMTDIKENYSPMILKDNLKARKRFITFNFLTILTVSGVLTLYTILIFIQKPTWAQFLEFLPYQLVFALTLGFKEEFVMRWAMQNGMESVFQSKIVPLLLLAFFWGISHQFFGEGTGRGILTFLFTFLGACWFGVLTEEFGNIIHATIIHIFIEIYAFYLIYGDVIVGLAP